MKIFLSILILTLLIISSVACNNRQLPNDETDLNECQSENIGNDESDGNPESNNNGTEEPEGQDYGVCYRDGAWHIVFDDIDKYKYGSGGISAIGVPFEDIVKYKNRVMQGELSHDEKRYVANHTESSKYGKRIFDPFNLYLPILPDGISVNGGQWSGYVCEFYLYEEDKKVGSFLWFYTQDTFEAHMEYAGGYAFSSRFYSSVDKSTVTEGDKVVTTHTVTDGETATVTKRTISIGERFATIYISEFLRYPGKSMNFLCNDGGVGYMVVVYEYDSEIHTDEWLLSFGLERYVEEAVE